jgi:hypothetical protein
MKREKIRIAVIDGQGGGVGRALVEQIKRAFPEIPLRALGTNSTATAMMIKAGADDGATGENAIVYNAASMDVILGPIGILVSNGLLGELTPAMASAIGGSGAVKILLPSHRCGIRLAAGPAQPMQNYLADAVRQLGEVIRQLEEG